MCGKIFTVAIVVVAILMALLAIFMPPEHIEYLIVISKFFDVMLPILAVGALLKYLCRCPSCANKCSCCKASDQANGGKCH
jgi:hypothetical protein